ncbi:hypothetical protein DFH08DRAFT_1082302 [Mycena albidolilacea]|uniref:Uncharacterized protein n=1 Tax=Mycena albidolilacea TaxID=1033008 RepID=A0AAD7EMT3_9AGAR|nr:hypothetical protein DFH08DRAFT_1082302 [Mycena albidolilacea]
MNSLSPASAINIMRGISSFGGDAKRPQEGDDPKPPPKHRREEIDLPIGSRPPISFNVLLKDLDVHGYYILLSLFTTESLDYINKNSSSIATTKLNMPGSDKQICILDSAHSEANILAERDMDRAQWTEAAQNYVKFMGIVGTPEDVARWTSHFGFLVTYEKAEKNFPALLRTDVMLRQAYNMQGFSFKRDFYQEQLNNELVLLRIDKKLKLCSAEWKPAIETRPPATPLSLRRGSRGGGDRGGRGGGSARGGARLIGKGGPFQEGSGGDASSTVCLICTRRGHYYSACTQNSFEDGSPLFCRISGNNISTIRSNETLCCLWNVKCDKVSCNHDNLRRHLCSFCGGGHHAFSWTCRKQPAY